MPASWQQWYAHQIDSWQGSASVQAFSDAAYRAFHNLLMAQFQSEDGKLPNDEAKLAKLSRLGARWNEVSGEVLPEFEVEGDRIFNAVQYAQWEKAQQVYEKRQLGGKHKQSSKSPAGVLEDSSKTLEAVHEDSSKSAGAHPTTGTVTLTGTETGTEKRTAPPSNAEPDSVDCRVLCESVGIFGMREQAEMLRCLIAFVKVSGKPVAASIEHMIARWVEYHAIEAKLEWQYGGSYKFFMSGKWDDPRSWPWRDGFGLDAQTAKKTRDESAGKTKQMISDWEAHKARVLAERAEGVTQS